MLPATIVDFFAEHQELLWFLTVVVDLSVTILLYRLFGKMGLYAIVVLNIMLSNLQGAKLTVIFGLETSLGAVLYSGIYFATDLLSEKYGRREANRAVLIGFVTSIIVVLMMSINLMFLPSIQKFELAESTHQALETLFDVTPRFVFGSMFVYLISQSLDVWVFHYIKALTKGKHLWLRNNLSTLISQAVDTVLYAFVVWWGIYDLTTALKLALAKYLFKSIIALLDTPFIYWARTWDVRHRDWYEFEQHDE